VKLIDHLCCCYDTCDRRGHFSEKNYSYEAGYTLL